MSHRPRHVRLKQSDFADPGDYARDFRAGGGPDRNDLDFARVGSGVDAAILRGIWGGSEEEFLSALLAEDERVQRERPHVFVRKWRGLPRKRSRG